MVVVGVAAFAGVLLWLGFPLVVPFCGCDGGAVRSLLFAACHDCLLAGVDGVELGAMLLVLGALLWAGVGVYQPDGGLTRECGVDGCLSCCLGNGEDVAGVLVVVEGLACQGVGDVVEVDDDVALSGVLADEGGFARRRTMAAP